MDEGLLFAVGSIVFILGGLGLVLVGLDWARSWQRRDQPDDAPHLQERASALDPLRRPADRTTPEAASDGTPPAARPE